MALAQSAQNNATSTTASNTRITTLTEEITEHTRNIASLNATATKHRAAIAAHLRDLEVSTGKCEASEESVQTKDFRTAGLIEQNNSFLAARKEELDQTKEIGSLKNALGIAREAYARLKNKFDTL